MSICLYSQLYRQRERERMNFLLINEQSQLKGCEVLSAGTQNRWFSLEVFSSPSSFQSLLFPCFRSSLGWWVVSIINSELERAWVWSFHSTGEVVSSRARAHMGAPPLPPLLEVHGYWGCLGIKPTARICNSNLRFVKCFLHNHSVRQGIWALFSLYRFLEGKAMALLFTLSASILPLTPFWISGDSPPPTPNPDSLRVFLAQTLGTCYLSGDFLLGCCFLRHPYRGFPREEWAFLLPKTPISNSSPSQSLFPFSSAFCCLDFLKPSSPVGHPPLNSDYNTQVIVCGLFHSSNSTKVLLTFLGGKTMGTESPPSPPPAS